MLLGESICLYNIWKSCHKTTGAYLELPLEFHQGLLLAYLSMLSWLGIKKRKEEVTDTILQRSGFNKN